MRGVQGSEVKMKEEKCRTCLNMISGSVDHAICKANGYENYVGFEKEKPKESPKPEKWEEIHDMILDIGVYDDEMDSEQVEIIAKKISRLILAQRIEAVEEEKEIRIKYQDIVYRICLLLDRPKNPCTISEVYEKVKQALEKVREGK